MGKNKKVKKEDENLKSLEKEVSDLKNIAARAQADLVNYRNRMKIELLEIEKKTIKNFALKILSVIDDIDLAIDNSKESSKELLEDGLKNIRNKFENLLKQKNQVYGVGVDIDFQKILSCIKRDVSAYQGDIKSFLNQFFCSKSSYC